MDWVNEGLSLCVKLKIWHEQDSVQIKGKINSKEIEYNGVKG